MLPAGNNGPRPAALVTGGSRRLGRELCLGLARRGFDIALHYRESHSAARATAGDIAQTGGSCELFQADLTDPAQVERLIPSVLERFPSLELLINSASIWRPSGFLASTRDELKENLAVHIETPYLLSRDFARLAGAGQIVNILDTAITAKTSVFFPYLLTKKALLELTIMCAAELAPGIRVNAVAPGQVLPPEGAARLAHRRQPEDNPLGRAGSTHDVLKAVIFLIENPHFTGQCLFVDGGAHLCTASGRFDGG